VFCLFLSFTWMFVVAHACFHILDFCYCVIAFACLFFHILDCCYCVIAFACLFFHILDCCYSVVVYISNGASPSLYSIVSNCCQIKAVCEQITQKVWPCLENVPKADNQSSARVKPGIYNTWSRNYLLLSGMPQCGVNAICMLLVYSLRVNYLRTIARRAI